MTELKCPFCQQKLDYLAEDIYGGMYCPNCKNQNLFGNKKMWQELIRTRKALEIALDAIDKGEAALIGCQEADDKYISDITAEDGLKLMSKAYKQIKALTKGGDNE